MFKDTLPNRATRDNAENFIARFVTFKTGGALRGEVVTDANVSLPWGHHLPEEWRPRFVNSHAEYVVWSYATPIAWYESGRGWTIPDVTYSVTTTRHQHKARMGAHYSTDQRVNGKQDD